MVLRILGMIALLAACTQGSGCAAGTGVDEDAQRVTDPRAPEDERSSDPQVPVAQERSYSAPVVVTNPVPPKPVRDGTPPIIYLLPSDGSLRVVDKTAGQEIAAVPAAQSRSILRIDDLTGVTLGKQTLVKGPLAPNHGYEIFLSTGSENTVRHGVSSPGR